MMKYLMLIAALMLAVGSTQAIAQDGGDVKTKFYNFDDLLIDGQYKKPQVLYTDARQKVKFERLLKLKKSFIKSLLLTAKERVFK